MHLTNPELLLREVCLSFLFNVVSRVFYVARCILYVVLCMLYLVSCILYVECRRLYAILFTGKKLDIKIIPDAMIRPDSPLV